MRKARNKGFSDIYDVTFVAVVQWRRFLDNIVELMIVSVRSHSAAEHLSTAMTERYIEVSEDACRWVVGI